MVEEMNSRRKTSIRRSISFSSCRRSASCEQERQQKRHGIGTHLASLSIDTCGGELNHVECHPQCHSRHPRCHCNTRQWHLQRLRLQTLIQLDICFLQLFSWKLHLRTVLRVRSRQTIHAHGQRQHVVLFYFVANVCHNAVD